MRKLICVFSYLALYLSLVIKKLPFFIATLWFGAVNAAPPPPKPAATFVTADSLADFRTDRRIDIETITISTRPPDFNVSSTQMGVQILDIERIRSLPALLGEVDVIKAIQMMPGVQMTSEGGSGFSVRGGSPDQNLVLLDDAVVYNPSHLMGFFSVFNNDFVSSAELYKGDMPSRYGGRLSALLAVNTLDRQPKRFSGTGGIGLISSRLMLEGPIGGNTSWHVAARRSYADVFIPLAGKYVAEDAKGATLYFYDVNAKLTHRFKNKKDMLQAAGYYGGDAFGMKKLGKINYGNGAASLTWRHRYNDRFLSYLNFTFTDYTYKMRSNMATFDGSWYSGIRDFGLSLDFEHDAHRHANLTYGLSATYRKITPGDAKLGNISNLNIPLSSNVLEYTAYLSNEQSLGRRVTLRYGVRATVFQNMGESVVYRWDENFNETGSTRYGRGRIYHTSVAAEPRVGVVVRTGPNSSVKASYAYNAQFMQLANNSASGSPLDVWFTAGPNIKPQRSHLASVGYFQNLRDNMFALSAELYYKDMRNVIDFKDGASLALNGKLDGEVRTGRGASYGLEVSAAKERGAWTGFVNYTLSRSTRTIAGINGGRTYSAPFDKTHSVNVSLAWKISPAVEVALSWVYSTGNPTTLPVGKYTIPDGDSDPSNDTVVAVYSARNAYRLPDYHRMDFSVTWHPPHKSRRRWRGEWNLSVYNVYNKKNPWMVTYEQNAGGVSYAEMVYLFGVVPSITYNFKF